MFWLGLGTQEKIRFCLEIPVLVTSNMADVPTSHKTKNLVATNTAGICPQVYF